MKGKDHRVCDTPTTAGVSHTVAGINIVLHEHVCEPTTFSRSPPLPERNDLLHHILVAPNTFPSGQIACPCSPARKYASAFDARVNMNRSVFTRIGT
eukprot:COSAG01_NODE_4151_length_5283_cov_3.521371_1_plen_97_part_00